MLHDLYNVERVARLRMKARIQEARQQQLVRRARKEAEPAPLPPQGGIFLKRLRRLVARVTTPARI